MLNQRVLVITDNRFLCSAFQKIAGELKLSDVTIDYRYSPSSRNFTATPDFFPVDVKKEISSIIKAYDLVISLHCKQLFPEKMVRGVRCVNIHPGYNPYNRGWYPQVFSIINKMPHGATIHEIDAELDHGPIIEQMRVPIYSWDTSLTVYDRVLEAELQMVRSRLKDIISGDYETRLPKEEGNLNYKRDLAALMELDLQQRITVGDFIDRLRATTHGPYKNSYFYDEDGNKVYVNIVLEKDESAKS